MKTIVITKDTITNLDNTNQIVSLQNETGQTAENVNTETPVIDIADTVTPALKTKVKSIITKERTDALIKKEIGETKKLQVPALKTKAKRTISKDKTDTPLKEKIKEIQQPKVPALNLESTLDLIQKLSLLSKRRTVLINTLDNLKKFVIKVTEQDEEIGNKVYNRCKLVIEDDERNEFVTTNTNLIQLLVEFVKEKCLDKLGETEAEIVIR